MKTIVVAVLMILILNTGGYAQQSTDCPLPAGGEGESMDKITKSKEEWKKILPSETYIITRENGTERPFTGKYAHNGEKGVYKCYSCGLALFSSDTKFDSGTGWPSFWAPVSAKNVVFKEDDSMGVKRVEVRCARCDAHLGHIFPDGPQPTNERYCINSAALNFEKEEQ